MQAGDAFERSPNDSILVMRAKKDGKVITADQVITAAVVRVAGIIRFRDHGERVGQASHFRAPI